MMWATKILVVKQEAEGHARIHIRGHQRGRIHRASQRGIRLPAAGRRREHGYREFMASVDALVIGRGTFDSV
jgi:hypothetical protein